jgi:hypothetical protein
LAHVSLPSSIQAMTDYTSHGGLHSALISWNRREAYSKSSLSSVSCILVDSGSPVSPPTYMNKLSNWLFMKTMKYGNYPSKEAL